VVYEHRARASLVSDVTNDIPASHIIADSSSSGSQIWNALPPSGQLSAQIRPWCNARQNIVQVVSVFKNPCIDEFNSLDGLHSCPEGITNIPEPSSTQACASFACVTHRRAKGGAVTLLETKDESFAYFTQCAQLGEQLTCLLSYTCPCSCVTAHLIINRHAVASAPFFAPSFTPPPHTSSIQGKEALCAHSCITIWLPRHSLLPASRHR